MNETCLRAKERQPVRPGCPRTRCGVCFVSARGAPWFQGLLKQLESK
jgi:hypothetical protein